MRRRGLFWKLWPPLLGVLLAAFFLMSAYGRATVRRFNLDRVQKSLETQARLVSVQIKPPLSDDRRGDLDDLCDRMGAATSTRVTILRADGVVLGDSDEDPAVMDNHRDRPELARALAGEPGASTRFSHTLQQKMIYVAVPLRSDGEIIGAVRMAYPAEQVSAWPRPLLWRLGLAAVCAAAAAALVSLWVTRRISASVGALTAATEDLAAGRFGRRVPVPDTLELAQLATALNWMAVQLEEKVGTIRSQRREERAVLSNMLEGVLAVNTDECVMNMNEAAGRLLGVETASVRGRNIIEVVRNTDVQTFVRRVLKGDEPVETDLLLHDDETRFLQAHGSIMRDADDNVMGAVVVLNDVTRLRRLENVRRDFVANVSHELKTPITTIKGFVETLLDGAMYEKESAERFLTIVSRHADRLTAIIEDLLSLSRVEQENERGGIELEDGAVEDVLRAAVEACAPNAERRGVSVSLACPPDLRARLNPPLLQQAVVNLLDNAVKYSPEGSQITVAARRENGGVEISVQDQGSGIASEHLPRLFERFYRVDKARSRELGGTGLGLAIVKHVAQAHRGQVRVSSQVGKGSIFTLHLPRSEPQQNGG